MAQVVPKRNNEFIRIAAVVKQDSWFKSLKDLKGAKACFTGYRDIGKYNFLFFFIFLNSDIVICNKLNNLLEIISKITCYC